MNSTAKYSQFKFEKMKEERMKERHREREKNIMICHN